MSCNSPKEETESTTRSGVELRSLKTEDDFECCLQLQRQTWGNDFRELVPPTILAISQKVGGVAMGAFEDGEMLGFVYGLSGIRDGELAHWSHMLAVREDARGRGLGRDLKEFQRDFLARLGIGVMYWTFDPLVARNACLNLIALGARPVEYVRDMYGKNTGSAVHSDLGTDRFVVRWRFGRSGGSEVAQTPGAPSPDAVVTGFGFSDQSTSWVEIPADIELVKQNDAAGAWAWRERTRQVLQELLASGARCLGLHRKPSAGGGRFYYVFAEQQASLATYDNRQGVNAQGNAKNE